MKKESKKTKMTNYIFCSAKQTFIRKMKSKFNIIHHFISVFFLYFFYHSTCPLGPVYFSYFNIWFRRLYWSRCTKDLPHPHWLVVVDLHSEVFLKGANAYSQARYFHFAQFSFQAVPNSTSIAFVQTILDGLKWPIISRSVCLGIKFMWV